MRQPLSRLLALTTFLALALSAPAGAEMKPGTLAPAPKGFDARRDGIDRGKVETVEYDSKTVGTKRKMVVYTPPGYSKDAGIPSSTCCTAPATTRPGGGGGGRPT